MELKILLIEDNPDHIEITRRILHKADQNYQIVLATSPKEGLEKISVEDFDAVLCDYRFSDLTALDILKEINSKNVEVPFIVTTSMGNEKVAVDMMKEGAYDYIVKDVFYTDVLDKVIKNAIDRHKTKKEKEKLEKEIVKAYGKLKETQNQLIQAEKLSAVGQLASGVAHEVRNPLGIIMQGVNYLEKKMEAEKTEADILETLAMIKDSIKRADKIVNSLLDFSKAGSLYLKSESINSILEESLGLVRIKFKFENIDVIMETKKDIPNVLADKNKLEQVFINILLNAFQAMPDGGRVIIRTYDKVMGGSEKDTGRREGDYFKFGEKAVIVEIQDTGCGISEDNLKKIFDPFFTTKGPVEGAGLGLSVTKSIIDEHKGIIDVESKIGKGTKLAIILHAIKE